MVMGFVQSKTTDAPELTARPPTFGFAEEPDSVVVPLNV